MPGGDAPDAPNYKKQAEATAKSNYEYGLKALDANRITQNNPYGSIGFTKDANGNWTMNTNMSPEQQAIFGKNTQFSTGAAGAANTGLNAANGLLSNPTLDMNALPAAQINPGQTAQDAIMARLTPEFDRQQAQMETQLRNQGVMPGSEAYNNAMDQLGRQKNDAISQAALQGIDVGQKARLQGITEQEQAISTPLNTITQLNNLGQAQLPQQSSYPLLGQTAGVDYSGAAANKYAGASNAYNAQQAQQQSLMNGLLSGGAMLALSDRRLKTNIKRIGELPSGLGWYSYELFGKPTEGVMADEVEQLIPSAVIGNSSSYKMVDYSQVR